MNLLFTVPKVKLEELLAFSEFNTPALFLKFEIQIDDLVIGELHFLTSTLKPEILTKNVEDTYLIGSSARQVKHKISKSAGQG